MKPLRPRTLLRPNPHVFRARNAGPSRRFSARPPPPPPSEAAEAAAAARKQSRLDRVISRLPGRLQRYLSPLRSAPLTHVTAFLVLHELTAIVPLVGLAATFHYADWLPPYISEGAWVKQGVERFGRYFRRKGWISDDAVHEAEDEVEAGDGSGGGGRRDKLRRRAGTAWGWGEGGVRVLVEVATAWAVTKALLPLRLGLSVWAMPWFARVALQPVGRGFKRLFGGRGKSAGTAGKS
ncbi:putative mitochondrial seryl-tRNA synthetase protein [Neofusicoccum parvum]|uniref:Mitochondrial seryl-tRNA synthetase protein n=1 Tax=Neofusicoccum parvum TaxID=310453 RepID=A0ACB5RZL8_9PEZI|nr:putative mitochondrial seryl-tRNA synthetase protein [Neofusicoccum parvum]